MVPTLHLYDKIVFLFFGSLVMKMRPPPKILVHPKTIIYAYRKKLGILIVIT